MESREANGSLSAVPPLALVPEAFSGGGPSGQKTKAEADKFPHRELAMGLFIVLLSHGLAVGNDFSLQRTAVMLLACSCVFAYGYFKNPYAPFYCCAIVNPLFPALGTYFALVLGGCLLVLWRTEQSRWRWRFSFVGLAFCFWSLASLAWAEEIDLTQAGFLAQVLPSMIMGIIMAGIRDGGFYKNITFLTVIACVIGSGATYWNWHSGKVTELTEIGRVDSFIRPDIFAGWTVFGFLGAVAWAISGRVSRRTAGLLFASLPVILVGMVLSGYRSSILVTGIGLLAILLMQKRLGRAALLAGVVGLMVASVYLARPEYFARVLARFGTMQEDRGSDRLDIWQSGLRVFPESPIIGTGSDGFRTASARYYHQTMASHSLYLGALVELGVIGLALLLGWLAVLFRKARAADSRFWLWPMLLAYSVQGLLLHEFNFAFFWIIIAAAEGARRARVGGSRRLASHSLKANGRLPRQGPGWGGASPAAEQPR